MKKSIIKKITFVFILTFSLNISSQSNLIFNQVLLLNLERGGTAHIVPQGKTWKIEHASNQIGSGRGVSILVNGKSYPLNQINMSSLGAVWLPEGTEINWDSQTSGSASSALYPANMISMLEFNIEGSSGSSSSSGLSAEGLQFSRVINYRGSGTTSFSGVGGLIGTVEVPEGKVWKITHVTLNDFSASDEYRIGGLNGESVLLGGNVIFYRQTTGYSPDFNSYPIWITSGTKDVAIGQPGNNYTRCLVTFTAIEYTIPN